MQKHKLVVSISSGFIWRLLLISLAVWFLYAIKGILLLFFMALVIVSAANPIVNRLQRKKIPRPASTAFLFILMAVAVVYMVYLIIPVIMEELRLLGENLPKYFDSINNTFRHINRITGPYRLELDLQKFNESISNNIASNTVSFFGGIFNVFVLLSLSFYMLVKEDAIKNFLQTIVPAKHQEYAVSLAQRIQYKMGRWLIGQLILVVIIFALDYMALTALGVPYAILLAIIGGVLEVIPYMGPLIALIPAALVGLTVSPIVGLMVIVLYVFIQQLENYVFTPLVMKKAVGLNPVAIILALLIGAELAGIIGVLLAVPAATAISVFVSDLTNKDAKEIPDQETMTESQA